MSQKETYDRERAKINSAVRAVRKQPPYNHCICHNCDSPRSQDKNTADLLPVSPGDPPFFTSSSSVPLCGVEKGAAMQQWKSLLEAVRTGDTASVKNQLRCAVPLGTDKPADTISPMTSEATAGAPYMYGSHRRLIHYAALYRQPAVVKELLAWGANPNAVDRNGWTALHCAVLNGSASAAGMLLAAGADAHARIFQQGGAEQVRLRLTLARYLRAL